MLPQSSPRFAVAPIIGFLLLVSSFSALGQSQLSLDLQYPVFFDEFKWVYAPSPGVRLNYTTVSDDEGNRGGVNYSLGFYRFSPLQDTFYYTLDGGTAVGTMEFTPYTIFMLTVGYTKFLNLQEKMDFYLGLDIGYYYTFYAFNAIDKYADTRATNYIGRIGISPKAGYMVSFTDRIGIALQSRLDLMLRPTEGSFEEEIYDVFGYMTAFVSNSAGVVIKF